MVLQGFTVLLQLSASVAQIIEQSFPFTWQNDAVQAISYPFHRLFEVLLSRFVTKKHKKP